MFTFFFCLSLQSEQVNLCFARNLETCPEGYTNISSDLTNLEKFIQDETTTLQVKIMDSLYQENESLGFETLNHSLKLIIQGENEKTNVFLNLSEKIMKNITEIDLKDGLFTFVDQSEVIIPLVFFYKNAFLAKEVTFNNSNVYVSISSFRNFSLIQSQVANIHLLVDFEERIEYSAEGWKFVKSNLKIKKDEKIRDFLLLERIEIVSINESAKINPLSITRTDPLLPRALVNVSSSFNGTALIFTDIGDVEVTSNSKIIPFEFIGTRTTLVCQNAPGTTIDKFIVNNQTLTAHTEKLINGYAIPDTSLIYFASITAAGNLTITSRFVIDTISLVRNTRFIMKGGKITGDILISSSTTTSFVDVDSSNANVTLLYDSDVPSMMNFTEFVYSSYPKSMTVKFYPKQAKENMEIKLWNVENFTSKTISTNFNCMPLNEGDDFKCKFFSKEDGLYMKYIKEENNESHSNTKLIVGIAVSIAVVIVIAVVILVFCCIKKSDNKQDSSTYNNLVN